MHKAIAIIQFKLEGQLLRRHKEFHMEDRCLLHRINPEKGTVTLADGKEYPMLDTEFPTIDWKHPYELTPGELDVMERLETAFRNCEKLQNHMRLLLDKGGLYKIYNGNLLFHGSIPLNEDGTFREVQIYGKKLQGKRTVRCTGNLCAQSILFCRKRRTEEGQRYYVVYLGSSEFTAVRKRQDDHL